jgi:hypothetical protein
MKNDKEIEGSRVGRVRRLTLARIVQQRRARPRYGGARILRIQPVLCWWQFLCDRAQEFVL